MTGEPMWKHPYGSNSVPRLCRRLKHHKDADERRRAAYLLGRDRFKAVLAQDLLMEALEDKEPQVRKAAATALGTIE